MSDYKLGPCKVEVGGSDLGKTEGGVTVTFEETYAPLHTDQDGENPVDEVCTGTTVSVEGSLAKMTLDNVAKLFKQTTSGSKVEIKTNIGTSLLANAETMVLKPYDGGTVTGDATEWLTVHQASFKANPSLNFNKSDQRLLAFTASGYPTDTGLIATFGDTSA